MSQPTPPSDSELVQRYLDNRKDDLERLDRLAEATGQLTDETKRLTDAVETFATKESVEAIREAAMTKTDHERFWTQEAEKLIKTRLRIRNQTWVLFAISVILMLIVTGVLSFFVYREHAQRVDACQMRNTQLRTAIPFYDKEINRADQQPNPQALITVLQDIKRASQAAITKC